MKYTGTALVIDTPNKNGRIYPREKVEKALIDYQKLIEEKKALGVMGYDGDQHYAGVDLSKVSHIVKSAKLEGVNLMVEIETLTTPRGLTAMALLNERTETPLWVLRPRGLGSLDANKMVCDYKIISIDIIPADQAS